MNAIEDLARLIKKLPGMGEKSSLRLCYHLLKTDPSFNKALGERIISLQEKIHPCPICGSYTEEDICEYCSSPRRDHTQLMVVEESPDTITINQAGIYNGLFHVLGGAINPLDGIGPEALSFPSLMKRIEEGAFKEVIIATNPTEEGDTTALYIRHLLKDRDDIVLTRLASGLPIGGDLGYADKLTLARSMRGRVKL